MALWHIDKLLHDGLLHHREDFVVVGEDFFDQGGHVVVGVFGKASAESDVGLAVGEIVVAGIDGGVAHVVDGVERFHAFAVFEGIFFDDDGLGCVGTFFVEVFVLADADVVVLGGVVGDDAAGLCPGFVDDFGLETYRAVVEASETIVEVFVDFAGEDGVAGYVLIGVALFEVVDSETDLGALRGACRSDCCSRRRGRRYRCLQSSCCRR